MSTVIERHVGNIRVIEFDHPNKHNPFSEVHENNIKAAFRRANADPTIKGVVVTGHDGRSFSAGGDFNEVKNLRGGDEVDRWIDRVVDLYASALRVEKPMIAAISGYAIGMGFQLAMMFDWRIMSATAEFRMPELKHGIACTVGATILEEVLGHTTAQEIIYACETIGPEKALEYRLVKEVTAQGLLVARAIEVAQMLAAYPEVPFVNTKRSVTSRMLDCLHRAAVASKTAHRAAFAARSSQAHFKNILGEKYEAVS
jgi:carboxymethylproline synthase